MTGNALYTLADRLGLAREYVSAAGERVVVADDSLRALAAAFGFGAGSEAEAGQSLAALERSRHRPLDPVIVAVEGAPIAAGWRGAAARATVEWRIGCEDGSERTGAALASDGASTALALGELPTGYHRLDVRCGDIAATTSLIVVPQRAWTPPAWADEGRREWALTAQLYSLRSERNWGIGDFSDLGSLAAHAAAFGASAVGLNPLHALFPANPRHLSPYSPSSRAFLNPVYIDVEAVPEWAGCASVQALCNGADFQRDLHAARESDFVDYPAVWALKTSALQALHRALESGSERSRDFAAFKARGGESLARFAVFEALQQHFADHGTGLSWRDWPAPFRDAGSAEVAAFAVEHADAVEFSQYLQWEADRQLGAQAAAMRAAGMSTGLYCDVAVGVDPNGAEAWGDQSLLVAAASVGAPPDLYNPNGQNWGLTPFNPVALAERAFAPFIAAIRANMRHAGAMRIDHVIGLQRLYWVPQGSSADAGGYVAYPYEQLMGIIALESHRHRCLVVGEDLGTVPEGFREDAERRGVLSYRLLMFEREGGEGRFLAPPAYPKLAAAAASTHDLPTLAGLWSGRDQQWRSDLGLYPTPADAARDAEFRRKTRSALIEALTAHGGLPPAVADALGGDAPYPAATIAALVEAAHCYLAAAPSHLLLVQIEDLAAEVEQMNLPGTVDEHPNWRRKLGRTIDALFADAAVARTASAIQSTRQQFAHRPAVD